MVCIAYFPSDISPHILNVTNFIRRYSGSSYPRVCLVVMDRTVLEASLERIIDADEAATADARDLPLSALAKPKVPKAVRNVWRCPSRLCAGPEVVMFFVERKPPRCCVCESKMRLRGGTPPKPPSTSATTCKRPAAAVRSKPNDATTVGLATSPQTSPAVKRTRRNSNSRRADTTLSLDVSSPSLVETISSPDSAVVVSSSKAPGKRGQNKRTVITIDKAPPSPLADTSTAGLASPPPCPAKSSDRVSYRTL